MSTLNHRPSGKEIINEAFNDFIKGLEPEESKKLFAKLLTLKKKVHEVIELERNDQSLYNNLVIENMREVWDNQKDAIYDDL